MSFAIRKAEPYRLFLFMSAVWAAASSMMFTIMAVYFVQDVGMNPFQLVLVGTILEVTYFLFEVPTGVVADIYSRRLSVIIADLLLGVGFLLQGLIPVVGVIMAIEVVKAIGHTFESGALQAWLADEIGEKRLGPALLRQGQVMQVASFLGIGLGVGLGSIRLNLPVIIGGITLIGLSLLLALFMPETGFKRPQKGPDHSGLAEMGKTIRSSVGALRLNRIVLLFFVVEFFWGGHSEGYDRLWEAHFLENFTFPALGALEPVVWFGIINAVSGLLSILLAEYIRRRVDMNNHKQIAAVLFLSFSLVGVGVILFGAAGGFGLALGAVWLVGVARSIGGPLMYTWLNHEIPSENRATLLSLVGQGNALGQMTAGPGIGWIGAVRSLRAAMVVSGLLLSPAVALFAQRGLRTAGLRQAVAPLPEE